MPSLPDGAEEVRRTRVFHAHTTPAGLRKSHRLKPGSWGEIVVMEGTVRYVLEDEDDLTLVLTPERSGIVAPERPHHVEPGEGASFYVRFLRTSS